MSHEILCDDYRFNGQLVPPVIASPDSGALRSKITKTGGSPTVAGVSGGFLALALDATNEIQNACLYNGDVLPYPIDKLTHVDFWVKLTASLDSHVQAAFGLSAARNDAPESSAAFALFRCVGANELLLSVSDGTNTQTQIDTGLTLGTTPIRCSLDFSSGIFSVSGGQSTGGKSQILASAEDGRGSARRICGQTRFNMSAYSGNLQLVAQIQKTANVALGTLSISRIRVSYKQ